jgi:hypothetical protein
MINPFRPVYTNILLPLGTSLAEPYVTLYNKSIKPLYNSVTRTCQTYDEAVVRYTAFIKTLELVVQFSVYFFLYQKGWHIGVHYFGLLGGAVAFSLIYAAGCWVDGQLKTNMNDICTGTWLYYKGARNFSANREAMLASIIIAQHLTHQQKEESSVNSWETKRRAAAEWLAQRSFTEPKPLPERPDVRGAEAVDSAHDLPDGERK